MAVARPEGPAPTISMSSGASGIDTRDALDLEDEVLSEGQRRGLEAGARRARADLSHRGQRGLNGERIALRRVQPRDGGAAGVARLAPEVAARGRPLLRGRPPRGAAERRLQEA